MTQVDELEAKQRRKLNAWLEGPERRPTIMLKTSQQRYLLASSPDD